MAVLTLVVLYWLRPLFYPVLIRFYVEPAVWLLPFLIFLVGVAVSIRRGRHAPKHDIVDDPMTLRGKLAVSRDLNDVAQAFASSGGPILIASAVAFATFVVMGILSVSLVGKQLYSNTVYTPIKTVPPIGAIRLTPKEVAERVAGSGFNSATERLTDFHLIRRDGQLAWTALRTPDGAYRAFTQNTQGVLELNASSSSRDTDQFDGVFKTAPGMFITDNLTWKLRKKKFFVQLDDPIALTDAKGKPLIAVSYIKYKGWFVRRPVFGGVFIVHPNGDIDDLSPAQAMKNPALVAAGRVIPEALARREQEAYAYKKGIFNKWFSHEDQIQISSTETNPQPYLLDFGKDGLKYVSAAEPYGRAFAVNALLLTDAVTGKTEIWKPQGRSELTGNRRVLETVRSLSIPGIQFADTTTNAPTTSGGFRVIEPRPIFVRGKLVFMTSIIPDSANNVSKTVFIDAASNRVAAIFNNDSDEAADQKIADFINGGAAEGSQIAGETGSTGSGSTDTTGSTGSSGKSSQDARERVDELLRQQRELIKQLEALRDELPKNK